MIIVEIALKREDGSVLVVCRGDATNPLAWQTPVQHQIKDGPGPALVGFTYQPALK